MVRPSGTVTFLFTDIEGSTRRWEANPEGMRAELAAHDDASRAAVEGRGGWLFKHTGDGVCAAFGSARAAVEAAIDAQRLLGLPVRMGIATGEAEQRGDDYFGAALNRAARVMAVGHGGQILLSVTTAGLVTGVELIDLGEHRLRDLSNAEHLFQVCADGLRLDFPRLRTLDAVPGNLPRLATSFVGRDAEVKELVELVATYELVTLTGVGGVGKTRLAVQAAAELVPDFPDGVWLVELAAIGDSAAVPDVVATVLGIIPQPGRSATDSIAETLIGRRLLMVFDNCEHVLDAAGEVIEAILRRSSKVRVIATSREGLRVATERLWPVPSLNVGGGVRSAAVELFVERAHAVVPEFTLDTELDVVAVTEICRRLDGIALAIELAAARMVSMTPVDLLARLNDRFRLLSGSRRSLPRHQTLRHAMQWSYDLLSTDEQTVLAAASVFAGGFELRAVTAVCGRFDESTTLDLLDSLVRKSLVTVSRERGRARYGLLETIRQFTEDQHAGLAEVRDRHARHFADEVVAHWEIWDGPGYGTATEWVEREFDNLRAGFRWAVDRADLIAAAAIAAHTPMIAFVLQQFEPAGWAEEALPAARAAKLAQVPRLATAASVCVFAGRAEAAVEYAQAAVALQDEPGYEPFAEGWASYREALALLVTGRIDRAAEICAVLASQTGLQHVIGQCGLTVCLPIIGRTEEAIAIAEDTISAARAHANPYFIAFAAYGVTLAYSVTDPRRALDVAREGLAYTRQHRLPFFTAYLGSEAARLEAAHGDFDRGLDLFTTSLDLFHQSGDAAVVGSIRDLVVFFDQIGRSEAAVTLYGTTVHMPPVNRDDLDAAVDHLRSAVHPETFDNCVRTGAAMTLTEAVHYAQHHIQLARQHQP